MPLTKVAEFWGFPSMVRLRITQQLLLRGSFGLHRADQAYTTSAGWLGYSDEKMRRLCQEAKAEGFTHLKMKVGSNLGDDMRRAAIIREEIGDD